MSNVRFCADLHLGHENMAKKRGFKSSEEHDNYIIKKWNSVVHKRDIIYILGDVTMEKADDYYKLDLLKGRKHVILGNHDRMKYVPKLLEHVEAVGALRLYSQKDTPKIFLSHCPIHPKELKYRVKYNIHGHIHEKVIRKWYGLPDKRYICVSMEQIDYTPKLLKELI